jgi:hypothetical protein
MQTKRLLKNGIVIFSHLGFFMAMLFIAQQSKAQTVVSTNQTGTQGGWYWSFWKDTGPASMTLYPGGRYTTSWNGVNNFTAGKGWAVGAPDRNICFSGTFDGGTNGFLAVYGWTKNALIEYYVVENYGQWTPPGGTSKGTFTSDGGTYNVYETTRTNQPSIIGTATFQQYWSVRTTKRSSGTVTFANHVAAWKALGMNMGTTWDYQIMESEGYQSTGSSDVTISACTTLTCTPPVATITASGALTFCTGNSVTLSANTGTGFTYVWKNGTTILTGATTSSLTATTSGSYTVTVTNPGGCSTTSTSTTVTVNAPPAAPTVSAPQIAYCQGAIATQLTASGTALNWYATATGGTATTTAPSPSTTTVGTTNYYVSQTTNGCEGGRAMIAVTVNALPIASISTTTPTTFCTGGSVVLTASSGASFKWFNGTTQVATAATYSATTSGSYTVEVTNAANCKASSAGTVVTVNAPPTAPTVSAPQIAYCQNAIATQLTASGTGLYWYATATGGTATATAPTPSTAATGTTNYYVSQTSNGCEGSRAMISVTVNTLPTAKITANGPTSFPQGGSVDLTANTGTGLSYKWFKGNVQVGTGLSYKATTPGDYTVEVTNSNTCSATSAAVTVTYAIVTGIHSLEANTFNGAVNPNPATNLVYIDSDVDLSGASFLLVNMMGKEHVLLQKVNALRVQLDVSNLSDGTYILIIRKDNFVLRKKVTIVNQ